MLPVLAVTIASLFSPASAQSHAWILGIALLIGFVVGVTGHITGSKALVIVGIVVIGLASAYFVAVFEAATVNQ